MDHSWLVDKPIAHRGFHNEECPENSMAAFERAVHEGFSIELDVRILKDGHVVVFHDANLQRMTNSKQLISQCSYEDIKNITLVQTSEKIPLLKTVLDQIAGRVPVIIEIKNERKAGKLEAETHKLLRNYDGDFAVQSFNPFSVAWFKRNAPNIIRGQIVGDLTEKKNFYMQQKYVWNQLLFTRIGKPHFINCDRFAYKWLSKHLHKSERITFICWTVKTEEEYKRAQSEFDNVVFEGFNPRTFG